MNKKNKADNRGFVYSTNPDFQFEPEQEEVQQTPEPALQKLIVKLETKHRAGKMVTLIDKFMGTDDDAEKLARQLRNYCGTGGSYKDGEIIVQGDQREKVLQYLIKNGYSKTKKH
jgi:translation initiation factor 1